MKFCTKCGKELVDDAVICPGCGCATEGGSTSTSTTAPTLEKGEKPTLARAALVCSFLVPIAGIICGIIGAIKYKTPKLKHQSIIAIVISIVVWIVLGFLNNLFLSSLF